MNNKASSRFLNALKLGFIHIEGDDFIFRNTVINLANAGTSKFEILDYMIGEYERKLAIAHEALNDIENWDDDLELEWDDQGNRAHHGLQDSQ